MKPSTDNTQAECLNVLCQHFELPLDRTREFISGFHRSMKLGLAGRPSSLRMLPAFIHRPQGTEKGRFLALDLGGTNVRVLEALLEGGGKASLTTVERFVIPTQIRCGPGEGLFNFLADCLISFFQKHTRAPDESRGFSFTFSFPFEPQSLHSGRLITWTKGFTANGVVGKDVAVLLEEALDRKGWGGLRVSALVNDTVGTLLAGAYAHPVCDLGVILGTGTNACYPERVERIRKLAPGIGEEEMIVNIEWGNYDGFAANRFDEALDRASPNPGRQRMEKMVSGLYLGELVRLAVWEWIAAASFPDSIVQRFHRPFSLSTEQAALLAQDRVEESILPGSFPKGERRPFSRIARAVFDRSARLAALAITAVLTWMDPLLQKKHAVAVDGALFENNPFYREEMERTLQTVLKDKADLVEFHLVKDGSGIGSAVAGALALGRQGR